MAKWVLNRPGTWDYPTLGFSASNGDILEAESAPDGFWSLNGDQGAAETVNRRSPGTGGGPPFTKPQNGAIPVFDASLNRYVDTNPADVAATPLGAALSATYAPLAVAGTTPSDVGARTGLYDAARNLYMPTTASLGGIRAKLAAVAAGTASARAKIAWVGHSEVSGFGGTPGVNDPAVSLRKALAAKYPVGTGMVTAYNNNAGTGTPADSRWSFDPAWVYAGGVYGSGNIQLHRRARATGKTATFTSDVAGTVVDIYTFGNTTTLTYSIDGGAAVTITPSGASAMQTVTVTGLANTTHTVAITTTTALDSYILGVGVRPSTAAEVSGMGFWGAEAVDWKAAVWYNAHQDVLSYDPDLTIVQLDVNEPLHGKTTATLNTNLTSVVSGFKATGDVILVASMAPNISAATWSTYRNVVYNVADAQGCPLVDLTDRFGSNVEATARGLMYDQHHPNGVGYANSGLAVAGLLL